MKNAATLLITLAIAVGAYAAKRPNVIIFISDDQGYADLSCNGNPILKTPNIDAFKAKSIALSNFHAGPTCAPTRAGLMTGRYCNASGLWHTITQRSLLRLDEETLPQMFQNSNYATAIFGKWHLGDTYPYRPFDRGFETGLIHGGGGVGQLPDYWGNDYFDDTYYTPNGVKKVDGYCTDVWVSEAVNFIEKEVKAQKPFFCYIAVNAPHSPYNVAQNYSAPFKGRVPDYRANFYGMIVNIDENFKKLEDALKNLGIEDDTILIFMTDNGSAAGSEQDKNGFVQEGFNAGMRGKKGSPYEGGHRVPFFISYPAGGIKGGAESGALTSHIDVLPTIAELCNLKRASDKPLHGVSLVKLLKTQDAADFENRAVITDSQRINLPKEWRASAVMRGDWRLVNGKELYNLKDDFGQKKNVITKHQKIAEELKAEYSKWYAEVFRGDYKTYNPIVIGDANAPQINPANLDAHYWQLDDKENICVWNQELARQGAPLNGYWVASATQDGRYRFELRRWPREADLPICGVDPAHLDSNALKINKAALWIDGLMQTKEVTADDNAVIFETDLKAGTHKIESAFYGENFSLGAYYVYIERL